MPEPVELTADEIARLDRALLGIRIAKARKAVDLSQDQLADALDVTQQAVSAWENATAAPAIDTLPRLAAVLNTTVAALFGEAA